MKRLSPRYNTHYSYFTMNKIDFTQPGGFPLTQDTLNFMQATYNASLAGICSVLGNLVVLSGCENNNGVIAPGVVAVNGEVLPTGGGSAATVFVDQTATAVTFADASEKDAYFTRKLVFGVNPNPEWQEEWRNFVYLTSLAEMQQTLVPRGAIMMWAGTTAPTGWAICDGTQGTPDLRGRFVMGAGKRANPPADDDNPSLAIGEIGGYGKVRLQAGQAGSFTVTNRWEDSQDLGGGKYLMGKIRFNNNVVLSEDGSQHGSAQGDNVVSGTAQKIQIQQADNAHENRPPYYVLAYIQKL